MMLRWRLEDKEMRYRCLDVRRGGRRHKSSKGVHGCIAKTKKKARKEGVDEDVRTKEQRTRARRELVEHFH
jgi:hypothetical protein